MKHALGIGMRGTVEHGSAHRVREQRRPHRAQLTAVAVSEVARLLLTQRLANGIHVASGVVGTDVRQRVADRLDTCLGKILRQIDEVVAFRKKAGEVELMATLDRASRVIAPWRELRDRTRWEPGWGACTKPAAAGEEE